MWENVEQNDSEYGHFLRSAESIQYQAALAITGAIYWVSQTMLYKKLGIESMKFRHQFKVQGQSSDLLQYLIDLIPKPSLHYTRRFLLLPNFKVRTELFRNLFHML